MKNVLMILVLLGGFALQNLDAQKGCTPCPPGCCVSSCCISGKGSAAAVGAQSAEVTFAAIMMGSETSACEPQKMTRKEVKACQTACKALGQTASADIIHTADVAQTASLSSTATPACQPVCKTNPSCKVTSSSTAAAEPAQQARVKEKS